MDDFLSAAAHELAAAIRRREVSSVEIVSAHLVHIGRHNPRLNAVVTLDADGAGLHAREADEALERGEVWGPLHGVPITLEDCHPTSGMRSTWGGLPRLADHGPERDGAVAASRGRGPSCSARPTARRSGPTRSFPEPTTPGT
jgi:amidase